MTSANHRPRQYFAAETEAMASVDSIQHSQPTIEVFGGTSVGTRLRLYIAEEQQILREAYQAFFLPHPTIEVVGTSGDLTIDGLVGAAATLKPSPITSKPTPVSNITLDSSPMLDTRKSMSVRFVVPVAP